MTRQLLTFLTILFSACGQNITTDNQGKTDTITNTSTENLEGPENNKVEHLNKRYSVGDLNNDKIADTAFVDYDQSVKADGTIEKICMNKNCEVTIRFNNNIPDLTIQQSVGIYIKNAEDLNADNANEIVLFSEWFEANWCNLYVWTFKGGKWKEIARTKAFLSEDKDFEKRIVKSKSKFYILGDSWDDSKGGVIARSLKIKIEK